MWLFSSRLEKKNGLTQNICHWLAMSLKEDIPDLFSKMAALKIKFSEEGREEDLLKLCRQQAQETR